MKSLGTGRACVRTGDLFDRALPYAVSILLAALLPFLLTSCGGASSGGPAQITVSLSSSSTGVDVPNGSALITATVMADAMGQGVKWSAEANGCTSNCYTLIAQTATTVTLVGPDSAAQTYTITVTGTSIDNPSASSSVTLNVNFYPKIVSQTLPDATINQAYSAMLQATLGTTPYSWSLPPDGGPLPPGLSLATDGTISGTPTRAGTSMFGVEMMDAGGGLVLATITLRVQPAAGMVLLNGQYGLLVGGGAFYAVAGSFTADSLGDVTGGSIQIVEGSFTIVKNITGTYLIGTDGRGNIQLVTDTLGSFNFDFAVSASAGGAATSGNVVVSSLTLGAPPWSGTFYAQDSSAFNLSSVSGSYTLGLVGSTTSDPLLPFGLAGVFTSDGNGNINSGFEDDNTGGSLGTNIAITGSYSAPDGNGSGTLTIESGAASDQYAYYIVNSGLLLIVQLAPTGVPPVSRGIAVQQTGTNFTNASLEGTGVFYSAASNLASKTADAQAGLLTFDGNGDFTLAGSENNGGAIAPTSDSGTYSVSSSGRVTLSGSTHQWVAYLQDTNSVYFVGTDTGATTGGFVPQQAGPYSNNSFSGTYAIGTHGGTENNNTAQTGILSPNGSGSVSGTLDINAPQGFMQGVTFTSTYSVDLTGSGTLAASSITDALAFYMDSPNHAYAISANPKNTSSLVQEWSVVTSTLTSRRNPAPSLMSPAR
jgi:hypothetical protein